MVVPRGTDYQTVIMLCNLFNPGYLRVFSKILMISSTVQEQKKPSG